MRTLSVDTISGVHVMRVARRRWWWPFSAVEEEWFTDGQSLRCKNYHCDWHPATKHREWYSTRSNKTASCFLAIKLCRFWDERAKQEKLLARLSAGLDERINQMDVN